MPYDFVLWCHGFEWLESEQRLFALYLDSVIVQDAAWVVRMFSTAPWEGGAPC